MQTFLRKHSARVLAAFLTATSLTSPAAPAGLTGDVNLTIRPIANGQTQLWGAWTSNGDIVVGNLATCNPSHQPQITVAHNRSAKYTCVDDVSQPSNNLSHDINATIRPKPNGTTEVWVQRTQDNAIIEQKAGTCNPSYPAQITISRNGSSIFTCPLKF